jgi:hypothetical protein
MPKILYREHRFSTKTRIIVDRANHILEDLGAQGYTLTLRQLFYQFVRRNWIANSQKEYKRLGSIVSDARVAGEMDWLLIEDRNRGAVHIDECPTYEDAFKRLPKLLQLDPWKDQDVYLEVAVEKDAQVGIIGRPASRWRAPYMACKGYLSTSEAWRMGLRFQRAIHEGKRPILLHLGDHDPSGLQMTDDNRDRLALFARYDVEVVRLALNMDQVEEHKCPPNPTKMTDGRAKTYEAMGHEASWELDALPPIFLDNLIADSIESYIDKDVWRQSLEREAELRAPLAKFAARAKELIEHVEMDELPLERLKELDAELPIMAEAFLQAAHRLPKAFEQGASTTQTRALFEIVQASAIDEPLSSNLPSQRVADFTEGFSKGKVASSKQVNKMELPKPDQQDLDLAQALQDQGESLNSDHRVVPFTLPDNHVTPTAEMPWDALEEAKTIPEGYTDEDEE